MELLIDNRQDYIEIDDDIIDMIKKSVIECLRLENRSLDYEISLSFVDNEEIWMLNKDYRLKDKPTDVLSFPIEEDITLEGQLPLLGDIVISAEMANEQSKEYNHSFKREVIYLVVHSMFHLMGYDHMEENEKEIMRNKEKQVMKNLEIFKK